MRCLWRLIPLVATAVSGIAQPVSGMVQPREADVVTPRPNADQGPTPVRFSFFVVDIAKVDAVDQASTVDFVVRCRWNDPRLADAQAGIRVFGTNEIWSPRLAVYNERRLFKSWEEVITVDSAGDCMYRQRFHGTVTTRLDLHDFPLDTNTLSITVLTAGHGPDEIEFIIDKRYTGHSATFSLVDAAVGDGVVSAGLLHFGPAAAQFCEMTYRFEMRRYKAYFLWKIILPLTIIVFMSWLVFWIDPSQLGPQLGLAATAVLTLIAYRFLLGSLVPRVSYLTRLDLFILGSTLLVFLALMEAVASVRIAAVNEHLGRRLDQWSRVLFPVAFVLVVVWAFRL